MSTVIDVQTSPARLLTFHLPQFHPIPENDAWWGKGFTEWTNVVKTRPRFPGHYQPHLPADLGFYDLRLPEAREAQADLARRYGIHGFCYYHYWFNGRRLLERPVDEILASGSPDYPFCLCWANEPWTRSWDGHNKNVILQQEHSHEDDLAHIRHLANVFEDPRYIRIDGKPFFLVYNSPLLPDESRTIETWREEAHRLGIGDLYLGRVESHDSASWWKNDANFDVTIEFFPEWPTLGKRIFPFLSLPNIDLPYLRNKGNSVYSYQTLMRNALAKPDVDHERFRCALVSWDNSARRASKAVIVQGSTPELYEQWLTELITRVQSKPPEQRVVFISSWNEWAEGNHLEPDARWGLAYLEATRRALESVARSCEYSENPR